MCTSYMVELIFTDPKIDVTGVYGTRLNKSQTHGTHENNVLLHRVRLNIRI